MEWLLFGGLILVMSIFSRVPQLEEGIKYLAAVKIPVGIVVFFVGLSSFDLGGQYIFGALMALIAGTALLFSIFKMIGRRRFLELPLFLDSGCIPRATLISSNSLVRVSFDFTSSPIFVSTSFSSCSLSDNRASP